MQLSIDLANRSNQDKVNVDLQWSIEVQIPKPGYLARVFRSSNKVEKKVRLAVTDINVPSDIVCDQSKLFSIIYNNQVYEQSNFPIEMVMESMDLPFQLLFNQSEIKDCKTQQDGNLRSYDINFVVKLYDSEGDLIDSHNDKVEVIFQPLRIQPQFELDLDESIQYSSILKRQRVGVVAAWVDEDFLYTPDQNARITLKLYRNGKELSDLVSFQEGEVGKNIRIKHGRQNVITLPLIVDFTTIANPISDEDKYTIEASVEHSQAYSPNVKRTILTQGSFALKKDQQGTELCVSVEGVEQVSNEHTLHLPLFKFLPKSRLIKPLKITLSNIATDNSNKHAGIYIKNLTIKSALSDEGVTIIGEDGVQPQRLVNISGASAEKMRSPEGCFIPNGINQKEELVMSFMPTSIVDVVGCRNYDFEIQSTISFDYWEDRDGLGQLDDSFKQTFKMPISWHLHLEPNPEWLCVDYGSSAIVCRYDKILVDLKKQKDAIFRKAEDGKFRLDNIEKGTSFLSSDIILHDVRENKTSSLCSQISAEDDVPYLDLAICLSPTSSLIKNDVRKLLPCLKILVGNELLPQNADYATFQYARRDEAGNIGKITAEEALKAEEESCVLRISSLFENTYASLFRYFIQPVSQDKKINKLVLTYPNTYTPAHLAMLEKIAKRTFPKVREDYLRFVSESDAVAAYYLQNWDKYNEDGDITQDEIVLVYDMGAGTLDLTLFKKQRVGEDKFDVTILGKIGTGKAGNYLDYLISEIIAEKVPNAVKNKLTVSTSSNINNEIREERLALKTEVKNEIKPLLDSTKNSLLKCGGVSFNSSIILEDERFTRFLQDITIGVFNQLASNSKQKRLNVNTIILSGRSCRLEPLQQALSEALDKLKWNAKIVKFDSKSNEEKTVVVDGAMAKASLFSSESSPVNIRSRRLYASYGLIFQKLGGKYHYVELLKNADLPMQEDTLRLDNIDGPTVIVKGIGAAGTIKLVQTYLSKSETEKAYNAGDMEFISVMEEYDASAFGGKAELGAKLMIDYKNNISLYIDGMASLGSTPKGIDLESEITKKSIWPVTI